MINSIPLLILIVAIWGTTFPIGKLLLNQFSAEFLIAIRFLTSGLFLFILDLYINKKRKITLSSQTLKTALLLGFFQFFAYYYLSFLALEKIQVSEVAIITSLYPITVALLTKGFWVERKIFLLKIIGILIGIFGTILIFNTPSFTDYSDGKIIMLFATLCLGIGTSFLKGLKDHQSLILCNGIAMFFAGLLACILLLIIPEKQLYFNHPNWLLLFYQIIMGTIFVFSGWNYYIIKYPEVEVSSFQLLVPIFGLISGFIILNEKLNINLITGALLIILAIIMVNYKSKNEYKHNNSKKR